MFYLSCYTDPETEASSLAFVGLNVHGKAKAFYLISCQSTASCARCPWSSCAMISWLPSKHNMFLVATNDLEVYSRTHREVPSIKLCKMFCLIHTDWHFDLTGIYGWICQLSSNQQHLGNHVGTESCLLESGTDLATCLSPMCGQHELGFLSGKFASRHPLFLASDWLKSTALQLAENDGASCKSTSLNSDCALTSC